MGTDIHMQVETVTYTEAGEPDGWAVVPGPIIDCWDCNGLGVYTAENKSHYKPEWLAENVGKPCRTCTDPIDKYAHYDSETDDYLPGPDERYVEPGKRRDEWYSDRNYTVFGVLANVRNGSGFAGVDTGDPLPIIAEPRGLPDDMSEQCAKWFVDHGGDHTDSHVTLEEVLAYDWKRSIIKRGVVRIDEYRTYVQQGRPEQWSGSIGGGSVRHVSQDEMNRFLINPPADAAGPNEWGPDKTVYVTQIQWTDTLERYAEGFLERMKMLALEVGEAPTRLVFNFDS